MLAFLDLPLAAKLVADGRLVSSEVISRGATSPGLANEALLLRHPRISFPSYPSEWSPALWLSAAELTLNLCTDLLSEGWILKDATPLNVLFEGTRPIFVDVASIDRANPSHAIWLAYGQFVRTFLLPMLAHSRLGWPLQGALMRRDGYEPEEIYAALSWAGRLRAPALTAVSIPMLLSRKGSKRTSDRTAVTVPAHTVPTRTVKDPEIARQVLLNTFAGLLKHMRQVTPAHRSSTWSDYAETAVHYSGDDHGAKRNFVAQVLAQCSPRRVLDIGCNTGVYSVLAADAGAEVVAIDTDLQAVDRLCTNLRATGKNILPLCVDLAYPTPATGWENSETLSFLDRCDGHFDTVMMLAVIHHLLLHSQIPLDRIASLCARITTRNLILEWVPASDPKFIEILRGREEIYGHLTEAAFRDAFAPYFEIAKESQLSNGRILFHFLKRAG